MKGEQMTDRRDDMIVLDVKVDNFYAFRNFHMNLSYPKKIVGSSIEDEYLSGHPNFRYKKVNIIMGANATGKSSLGFMLRGIFNFLDKKNINWVTDVIDDRTKTASFSLDLVGRSCTLYRIVCKIRPDKSGTYPPERIDLQIMKEPIGPKDSYEACVKRLESSPQDKCDSYMDELEKIEGLSWKFEYPKEKVRKLRLPRGDKKFRSVLENILRALDPSIQKVEKSKDVENAYVIRLEDRAVIIQDGEEFNTDILSSGTKSGVEIACMVSAMLQHAHSFYYCDEKFSYIHTDLERAVLSVMIGSLRPNDQLFFTTHNTDILDIGLPKHAFTFLRKNVDDPDCPITCVSASDLLKRNTDSLKKAVENDLFSMAPATDLIYELEDLRREGGS